METNLARFLFHYRSKPTATSTTGVSPVKLFLKRNMRTHLHLMRPNMKMRSKLKQHKMAQQQRKKTRDFSICDLVYVRYWALGQRWIPGRIVDVQGSTNIDVQTEDGRILHRHFDQVRRRFLSTARTSDDCLPSPIPGNDVFNRIKDDQPVQVILPTDCKYLGIKVGGKCCICWIEGRTRKHY